jgi:predicted O-methyltransferase YrrM
MRNTITLISSLIALVAVAYQIRVLRRVNEKLIKLVSPERDIRKLFKSHEKTVRENYRQSEFYAQLIYLLEIKAPIPATRSWAASPDVLLTLLQHARSTNPKKILDLGSGMSTLVLAKSAPEAEIFSIDNSAEFAAKTQKVLERHLITNVDLRVAPLVPHGSGVDWYDLSQLSDISDIDLLFIDGPPGSKNPQARHPAIKECISKLSPRAVIVIDDVARAGERAMAEEFARLLPSHTLEFLDHEKGSAVLLPD